MNISSPHQLIAKVVKNIIISKLFPLASLAGANYLFVSNKFHIFAARYNCSQVFTTKRRVGLRSVGVSTNLAVSTSLYSECFERRFVDVSHPEKRTRFEYFRNLSSVRLFESCGLKRLGLGSMMVGYS
jgi:hypothetical protein